MNQTRAYDDFSSLLSDLEGKPAAWEKQNLFLTISYLDRREIPGALEALAKRLQKPPIEIQAEYDLFHAETERLRAKHSGGGR